MNSQPDSTKNHNLVVIFGFLSCLSLLACIQALAFPRWPRSSPLSINPIVSALTEAGYSPKQVSSLPAHRSYDQSTSPVARINLNNGIQLLLVQSHVRERLNFTSDFISNQWQDTQLKNKKEAFIPYPVFIGTINRHSALQSCLVPQQTFGVSFEQLSGYIDQSSSSTSMDILRRWALFQPSRRYQCILATLRSPTSRTIDSTMARNIFNTIQEAVNTSTF